MKNLASMMMKTMGMLAVFLTALTAGAADKPSVHGMLVFGEKTIFFSHLPMFHSPHDYQVIFSVSLPNEARDLYALDKKTHPEQLIYTFVPELMILPEAILQTKTFKGDLYRGHFERGGTIIGKNIQVAVANVIVFKKFAEDATKPTEASYYIFGDGGEYWLAHSIIKAPDFDQILSLKVVTGSVQPPLNQLVNVDGVDSSKPLIDGQAVNVRAKDGDLSLESLRSVYLEFDDLSI